MSITLTVNGEVRSIDSDSDLPSAGRAAPVANAICAATGNRVRELPIKNSNLAVPS